MPGAARSALVLQGGGALGAYELGAARVLYGEKNVQPDLIAGVSIGAVTAVLLARPHKDLTPLAALEAFWKKVTVAGAFWPPPLKPYASFLGNRHFFVPRLDFVNWPTWTSFYDTWPLRETLKELIDLDRLADKSASPKLLVTATNLVRGQTQPFYSEEDTLTLDHIMASGSLPPAFPMTAIKQKAKTSHYWDGGLFDNTPLGAVLDRLDDAPGIERTVYVVNLFPNKASVPENLPEVMARMKNLQFANKTAEDIKLMCRFNQVADLIAALEALGDANPLARKPVYRAIKRQKYIHVPNIISITAPELTDQFADADFSLEAIHERARQGEELTRRVLQDPHHNPCSAPA
jgi:NTE family protein